LPSSQNDDQAQHSESASPEGDFEASGLIKVPRNNTCNGPQSSYQHHQGDCITVFEFQHLGALNSWQLIAN